MSTKVTNAYEHKDAIGRPLSVGDCVGYADANSLYIGTVIKMTAKMIRVKRVGSARYSWREEDGQLKYPSDMVLLEGPDVVMHLLKVGKS